jgi:hypothetical protein
VRKVESPTLNGKDGASSPANVSPLSLVSIAGGEIILSSESENAGKLLY